MTGSIVCKACNKRANIGDLRADKSGSGWICANCYEGQHPAVYKETNKPIGRGEQIVKKLEKIKYYCTNCGYKFYKEGRFSGICPYCSQYSIREEKDAETWLREVTSDDDERTERTGKSSNRIEILD